VLSFAILAMNGPVLLMLAERPFLLALGAFLSNRLETRRKLWRASAVIAALLGIPATILTGVGVFYLVIAIGFGWAYRKTDPVTLIYAS
jgi:hypothetical protein